MEDLAGVSKPATKLIEEISKGIGAIYKPIGIKREAKAEAFKIRTLSDAKSEQIKILKEELENGKNELVVTNDNFEIKLNGDSIESRAIESMISQEVKKQINLDSIVMKSIDLIEANKSIKDEPVDEDWMTRFINITQNISNEEIQNLWAKILADEVSSPNSYSLRTLDLLKNITSFEAKTFMKLAKLTFDFDGTYRAIYNKKYLESNGISLNDVILLEELSLVNLDLNLAIEPKKTNALTYFDKVIIIENNDEYDFNFSMITLTRIGCELIKLSDRCFDIEKLTSIVKGLKYLNRERSEKLSVSYADYSDISPTGVVTFNELSRTYI